ncbi:ABC transporter substrate-binding protein [Paenibacillus sp. MBLB4367]|uniref:ABC transporter substrate-binding protein n=1 Tax=Paenibacillus sp. MBLB4367 TaxID=3384767 RepID=UPI003907F2A3
MFLVMIAIILTAAGCGSKSGETNNAASSSPKANAAPSASASPSAKPDETRTIKHAMGEETLKGTPQRVVILTNEGTEALLAVGIKPVGAVNSWVGDPWYDHIKADMQSVTPLGEETQPNIELIASLKPDLIIGNKVRHEKIYEQLKKIAPTVFAADLAGDWKINFALYTAAVNKKAEGEKALAAYDKRVADVKAKLGTQAATKVSIVRFTAADIRIYQKQTFAGVLLNQLGVARPASQDKDQFVEKLTKERIPDMDGDVMFYFTNDTPSTTDGAKVAKEWLGDPLFKNLNVAKNNKVIQVDQVVWNLAGGYKAANLLLDELIKFFEVN